MLTLGHIWVGRKTTQVMYFCIKLACLNLVNTFISILLSLSNVFSVVRHLVTNTVDPDDPKCPLKGPVIPVDLGLSLIPVYFVMEFGKLLWIWQFSRRLGSVIDPVSGVTTQRPAGAYSPHSGRGHGFPGIFIQSCF